MEDMQSVDSLREAIDGFCSVHVDASREEYAKHLNVILVQVASGRGPDLSKLVTKHLGAFLTHHDSNVRMRAVLLLAELLQRLPELPINRKSGASLCGFFAERIESDYDSAIPCFLALKSLLKGRSSVFVDQPVVVDKVVKSVLGSHHIPSMAQSFRYGAYELVGVLLEVYAEVVRRHGMGFVRLFVEAMDGEKDPRCLLLCLKVCTQLLELFDEEVVKEAAQPVFDITCVYFPITFRPPPNDPYGITTESLVQGLTSVFCATPYMAQYVIPMTLDKLKLTKQEVSLAKIDSFKLLSTCIPRYGIAPALPFLPQLQQDVYHHVVNAEEAEVADAAVGLVRTIAKEIAKGYEAGEYETEDGPWGVFVGGLLRKCAEQTDASIDSMLSQGSARVVAAVAESSGLGLRHCAVHFKGRVEQWLRPEATQLQRNAALNLLLNVLRGINEDVDYPPGAHPLEGLVSGLFSILMQQLSAEVDRSLPVQGIEMLICRPPSQLLSDEEMREAVRAVSACMMAAEAGGEGDDELKRECLEALGRCGQASKVAGTAVMEETVEVLLQRLGGGEESWALEAMVELCKVPQVFAKTVPALMKVIVANGTFVADGKKVASVLRTVDEMVKRNSGNSSAMSACLVSEEAPLVPTVITSLLNSEDIMGSESSNGIANSCSSIVRNAVRHGEDSAQQEIAKIAVEIVKTRGDNPLAMRRMLPVITAVLGSLKTLEHPELEPEWAAQVSRLLYRLVLNNHKSIGQVGVTCSSQLIAAVLNKMDEKEMVQLREEVLLSGVEGEKGMLEVACGKGDVAQRVAALECVSWVLKGLSLRGDQFGEEISSRLLMLLEDQHEQVAVRRCAALAFGLAMKESEEVLNAKSFTKKVFLFEQKFFAATLAI